MAEISHKMVAVIERPSLTWNREVDGDGQNR